jgi:hypothetical protein
VKAFRNASINVKGLILPMDLENKYFSDQKVELVEAIRASYPGTDDLYLVYPFTTFVPKTSNLSWVGKFQQGYDVNSTYAVQLNGLNLDVEIFNETSGMKTQGYCMDIFNPRFNDFLLTVILDKMREPL